MIIVPAFCFDAWSYFSWHFWLHFALHCVFTFPVHSSPANWKRPLSSRTEMIHWSLLLDWPCFFHYRKAKSKERKGRNAIRIKHKCLPVPFPMSHSDPPFYLHYHQNMLQCPRWPFQDFHRLFTHISDCDTVVSAYREKRLVTSSVKSVIMSIQRMDWWNLYRQKMSLCPEFFIPLQGKKICHCRVFLGFNRNSIKLEQFVGEAFLLLLSFSRDILKVDLTHESL